MICQIGTGPKKIGHCDGRNVTEGKNIHASILATVITRSTILHFDNAPTHCYDKIVPNEMVPHIYLSQSEGHPYKNSKI